MFDNLSHQKRWSSSPIVQEKAGGLKSGVKPSRAKNITTCVVLLSTSMNVRSLRPRCPFVCVLWLKHIIIIIVIISTVAITLPPRASNIATPCYSCCQVVSTKIRDTLDKNVCTRRCEQNYGYQRTILSLVVC